MAEELKKFCGQTLQNYRGFKQQLEEYFEELVELSSQWKLMQDIEKEVEAKNLSKEEGRTLVDLAH